MGVNSHFADPVRSSSAKIAGDSELLQSERALLDILGTVSGISAVLDENRQIVYANDAFLGILGIGSIEQVIGRRPGEAVSCINSATMEAGCGTSQACMYCGAVNSILECRLTGKRAVRETRISSVSDGKTISWDLKVTTNPIVIREKTFYLFTIEDISNEKRQEALERVFFHDILNSAGNLDGLISMLDETPDGDEQRELIALSKESSRELIDEIIAHRQLRDAEKGDLVLREDWVTVEEVLKGSVNKISHNTVSDGRDIITEDLTGNVKIFTDKYLLQRVLINMLKNAVEATEVGGEIFASATLTGNNVRFTVRNNQVMPDEVRHQVFQRSFSTKGKGRGLGTYSVKLLSETYLHGKAGFSSTTTEGTVFWIDLPANYR